MIEMFAQNYVDFTESLKCNHIHPFSTATIPNHPFCFKSVLSVVFRISHHDIIVITYFNIYYLYYMSITISNDVIIYIISILINITIISRYS